MARPKLNRIWANQTASARRDPGDQKYITGWVSEIPTYQVLNFLQWKNDTTILALAERGIAEWGPDVVYYKSAVAWDETVGQVYLATVANPRSDLAPSKNSAQWQPSAINITRVDYDNAKANWQAHIANVSNPHKLTAGQLSAYTKAEVDNILSQYRTLVANHANNTNNPHKTTAAQIGAVPVTGGTYTGQVTFQNGIINLIADGSAKFLRDDTGVWIGNGKGRLGLRSGSTIVPMVGTSDALYKIVTENDFAQYKLQFEQRYAVPSPNFQMNGIRDANIQRGPGVWNANWDIAFAGDTGWTILDVVGSSRTYLPTVNPLEGAVECTLAMKFRWRGAAGTDNGPVGNRHVIGFGGGGPRLIFVTSVVSANTRYLSVYSGDTGGVQTAVVPVLDSGLHTAVAVRRATNHELWIDGVLVANQSSPNTKPLSGVLEGIRVNPIANLGNENRLEIADYKAWNVALTPEQISTL